MKKAEAAIRKFNEERNWDQFHSPSNLAKSIAIEAGELLECFQWSDTDFDIQALKEETADVLNYCIQLCQKMNWDPETIILEKIEQNAKKYPVDKARNSAKKYTELE